MWEAVTLIVIFGALVTAGLLFVNHSLYKDFEGKDPIVQGLFAVVFGLSVNLLLLILSEILGALSHRPVESFSSLRWKHTVCPGAPICFLVPKQGMACCSHSWRRLL